MARLSDVLAAIEAASPLVDTITIWEAPYDGMVQVTSDVALLQSADPARANYETADGVRVAIQLEGAEVWTDTIAETDYASRSANVGPLSVSKGDRVYFRVLSRYDGAYDEVSWSPVVDYVGEDLSVTDANNLPSYVYDYAADFTLFAFGNGSVDAPKDGVIQISGTLNKSAPTTDDVTLDVLVNGAVVDTHTFAAGTTGSYTVSESVSVLALVVDAQAGTVTQPADSIAIQLSNDSRIDAAAFSWSVTDAPRFHYTAFADGSDVTDTNGDPNTVVSLPATINLLSGSNFAQPSVAWVVPLDGQYTITPEVDLAAGVPDGTVYLTLKSGGVLLAKQAIDIVGGVITPASLQLALTTGTEIWIEYSDPSGAIADFVTEARADLKLPNPAFPTDPVEFLYDDQFVAELYSLNYVPLTGENHRGWSHLGYNGNESTLPIQISDADLDMPDEAELQAMGDTIQDAAESGDPDDSVYDTVDQKIFSLMPHYDVTRWVGPEAEIYVAAAQRGSSRISNAYPSVPDPMEFAGARGVPQISVTENRNITIGVLIASASRTKTSSRSVLDYMDVNGDSFPDILSQGRKIQYTRMLGALDTAVTNMPNMEGFTRSSRSTTEKVGIGGSTPLSMGDANGHLSATGGGGVHGQISLQLGRATIGFSSDSPGDVFSDYDLQDINADGLPDLVKQDGAQLTVKYNIGYSFLPRTL